MPFIRALAGRRSLSDGSAIAVSQPNVGRQPDGSLALVPIWMTEEPAAAMTLVEAPRLFLPAIRFARSTTVQACSTATHVVVERSYAAQDGTPLTEIPPKAGSAARRIFN